MAKAKSPAKSFKGWELGKYLKGRKKLIITVIGAVAGWVATSNPALAAMSGAGAELLYAILEYWIKKS